MASWETELDCRWRAVPRIDDTGKGEQIWGVNVNILSQGRPGFSAEGPLWEREGEGSAPPAEPLPLSQPRGPGSCPSCPPGPRPPAGATSYPGCQARKGFSGRWTFQT